MTIRELYNNLSCFFKKNCDGFCDAEVEYIISEALGIKRLDVLAFPDKIVSDSNIKKTYEFAKKRAKKIPLSWIFKKHNFCGMEIIIDTGVFVPRPETEDLAQMVLEYSFKIEKPIILDFCSGSGAIGLYIAFKNQNANVFAIEKLKKSYRIAIENKKKMKLQNYFCVNSDKLNYFTRKFDIIVSNPPYVPSYMYDSLPDDVKIEPKSALISGNDGLLMIKHLAINAKDVLKKGGVLFVEVGEYYSDKLIKIFKLPFIKEFQIIKDYNNKDRYIKAVYNG
ncbi:MAG: peptide chain release factor N(5)-glutamine methyltransferase [Elusimicrobiota bacterium]